MTKKYYLLLSCIFCMVLTSQSCAAVKPIVNVGISDGKDMPAVKFVGTAKRADNGSFQLTDDEPWGWIKVGEGALDSLKSLSSFTIMGWLKPDSLQVGHGGNRILFCLQENRSGIDLVHHNDGRLRLSVNEWPDRVSNDSSSGKLQVGKWIFFAVSYDSTASGDNVSWYFSEPLDTPGQSAVTLDRKTSYNPGPVDSNIGPLVVGNFNETMESYGMDRQFRGDIRALQIFGSSKDASGALSADEIGSQSGQKMQPEAAVSAPTTPTAQVQTEQKLPTAVPNQLNTRGSGYKPRIINTTDLGADPDDEQSMVRFLVCSNEFDVEGLIVATGCWKKSQSNTMMLDKIVNAYAQVYDNLKNHADGYPMPEYLKSISVLGQRGYGMSDVGDGKDSPGSEMIIAAVDKDDPRPVWVGGWGGVNNVAQAIWKVQNTRSAAELKKFISKLRVFDILGQDDAGAWLAKNFPDLFYIRATGVYGWQPEKNGSYQREDIQSHGPLGAVYPNTKYATEGDTPAFMHVYPNGLNDPDQIDQGGWGGRFSFTKKTNIRSMSGVSSDSEMKYAPYEMYGNIGGAGEISRWRPSYDNDFAARMDWTMTSDYSKVNHHPIAVVNGDATRQVLEVSAATGSSVTLSAVGSSDPDNNSLVYSWSFYKDPSSYSGDVSIEKSSSALATVGIPSNSSGKKMHIILELHDDGSPNLYAYCRVIINVK